MPREIDFLRRNNEAKRRIMNLVEMPNRMTEDLVRFIRVNEGKLGRKRREGEFEKLTDDEVVSIEAIVRDAFEDSEEKQPSILVTSEIARKVGGSAKESACESPFSVGYLCGYHCGKRDEVFYLQHFRMPGGNQNHENAPLRRVSTFPHPPALA